jgi:amidase
VPWREAGPVGLAGLRIVYSPGYPPAVAGGIRAGTDHLAGELASRGAIVEDRLPDPALAGQGRLVEELWSMLAPAAQAAERGSGKPGSGPLWDYLAALDRRDRFMATWDRFMATCDVLIAPALAQCAWRLGDSETGEDSPQEQATVALMLSQVSGCPMVVIPAGTDSNSVPFGIQVIGRRWHDEQLLAITEAITTVTGGFRAPSGF